MRITAIARCLGAAGLIVACTAPPPATIQVAPSGWQIQTLGTPAAEVYTILAIEELEMPTYLDCADADGAPQPATECSLGLVFIASPDYAGGAEYADHVQSIIRDLFAAENAFNRSGVYGQRLRPFQYYATNYRYPESTPENGQCNPGLPAAWAPAASNGRDVNAPAWDCNLALSTAATELDIGFIMHQGDQADRNRYNLFSSEYNSHAAILHELSHAAFAMSDEAPSTLQGGAFFPQMYPNIYADATACAAACATYGSTCVGIPRLRADGGADPAAKPILHRCHGSRQDDATNIMYFYPQPEPGDNRTWDTYAYMNAAVDRLRHIFVDWCSKARC